ncbi:MAG: methanogenesis marker 17 protein [Methanoregula sp.]|nr:MAG: methanogenesis marker 17 protein [Methanoregula sp.]
MQTVEYFEVECPEPLGGEYYKQIANDVLLDHNLIRAIFKLHIWVDPGIPIFVAVGVLHKITSLVRIRDFAAVNPLAGKITLVLANETYLALMLRIFLERFGQDHVEQADRFTVILRDVSITPGEVEDIVVADPSESVYKDLIYALRCIAPEGFRVRRERFFKDRFWFVASEDTLEADVDAIVQEKFAKMGEVPP